MAPLRDRPTPDLIVMGLAVVVAFVIIISTTAVVYAAISPAHETDAQEVAKNVGELTSSLIALIIGYIGGRGVGGNGNGSGSNRHSDQG